MVLLFLILTYRDVFTEGDTITEALHMAKEALELHIYNLESDNEFIPKPSSPDEIVLPKKAFVSIIEVWMPMVRDEM